MNTLNSDKYQNSIEDILDDTHCKFYKETQHLKYINEINCLHIQLMNLEMDHELGRELEMDHKLGRELNIVRDLEFDPYNTLKLIKIDTTMGDETLLLLRSDLTFKIIYTLIDFMRGFLCANLIKDAYDYSKDTDILDVSPLGFLYTYFYNNNKNSEKKDFYLKAIKKLENTSDTVPKMLESLFMVGGMYYEYNLSASEQASIIKTLI